MKEVYWMSHIPTADDFGQTIGDTFVDGATSMGPWALMAPTSFRKYGLGLGTGRGQKYVKQDDGRFMKVEG